MNFAFGAIIIVFLLLPGAAVVTAYYRSFKEKKSNLEIPTTDILLKGLLLSFLIHTTAICILKIFNLHVRYDLIYNILIGKPFEINNIEFTKAIRQFVSYNASVIIIIWSTTKFVKKLIIERNIDINYYSFRVTNYWYHIFSARYLDTKNVQGTQENTDLIFVDALVGNNMIYSGFLKDFNYSPNKDELENIVLQSTTLTRFESVKKKNSIPGDVFIIPMSKVENLNIYYLKIEPGTENIKAQANDNEESTEASQLT